MYDKVLNDQQKRQMFSHFDFYYDVRFAIVYTVIAIHTHAQITETQWKMSNEQWFKNERTENGESDIKKKNKPLNWHLYIFQVKNMPLSSR